MDTEAKTRRRTTRVRGKTEAGPAQSIRGYMEERKEMAMQGKMPRDANTATLPKQCSEKRKQTRCAEMQCLCLRARRGP